MEHACASKAGAAQIATPSILLTNALVTRKTISAAATAHATLRQVNVYAPPPMATRGTHPAAAAPSHAKDRRYAAVTAHATPPMARATAMLLGRVRPAAPLLSLAPPLTAGAMVNAIIPLGSAAATQDLAVLLHR